MMGKLEELVEDLKDSCQDWKVKHSVKEILILSFSGISAQETTISGVLAFARCKKQWLRKNGGLTIS